MNATVQLLWPADAPAYKRLRDEMLAAFPEAFTSDAGTERLRPAESYADRLQAGERGFTLGALQAGELLGALTCQVPERAKERHIGHIVGMMVQPAQQGRGVGGLLLAAAIERARADGRLLQLVLSVTRGNEGAQALYGRAGFVPYGCLPRAIRLPDGRCYDKQLMALSLDGA